MPVFIFEPDAFDRLCQAEGEEYDSPDLQDRLTNEGRSFAAFKEAWERAIAENPNLQESQKDAIITVTIEDATTPTIHGSHGWNRYIVYYSGEIVLLEHSAPGPEYIDRAKRAGFRTRPEAKAQASES